MIDQGMPRPVWLLDAPLPLESVLLILEQGPERSESGWWDGKGVARDYYIARRAPDTRHSHGRKAGYFRNVNPSVGICTECSPDGGRFKAAACTSNSTP